MKPRTIYIVSLNGTGNAGGVERVSYYFEQILKTRYPVKVVTAPLKKSGRLGFILNPLLISLRLFFTPNKFVLSNSWNSFLYPADISVHHGTTRGINEHLKDTATFGTRLIAFMEKLSAKLAKNILSVSINCSNELLSYYKIKKEKIFLLNNFVDDSVFTVKKSRASSVTKIIFVGALVERKGLSDLVRLAAFIEGKKNYKLLIATNTSFNTEKFSGLKNTEIFTGLQFDQMPSFYQKGDVLFFPTRYEGFSMSTLEALSCGIPVTGSGFAVTEELESYKFCRRLEKFNPEDVLKEADSLKKKFSGKKDEIHETIKKRFGKEAYAKKFLEYVDKIMQGRTSR
ncbi:glycosyltransferase family 4 protein [Treponema sp.]|uniref:glycosyltransferase family 4 protein n=1 Tax=Treponema sp. TaxID=166 RepID=UPI00298EBBA1|nr:glycosyltransferase family 4 protein [Treponema sp.]